MQNKIELTYNNLLELITNLSLIEKEEVKFILERNITEEKRNKVYKNYVKGKKEYREGKLNFSDDLNQLMELL